MQEMQSIFHKLKEAADSRVQIARLEVFCWQRISSAMQEASYYAGKWPEIKKPPRVQVQEPMPVNTNRYVTIKEACQFLGISRTTIYRLMSEGQIPYTKMGGHATRYHLQDLETFARKSVILKSGVL